MPTYRLFPPVYYYLGRASQGLKGPAAADAFKTFLAFRESADGGPLVADARRLLARPEPRPGAYFSRTFVAFTRSRRSTAARACSTP